MFIIEYYYSCIQSHYCYDDAFESIIVIRNGTSESLFQILISDSNFRIRLLNASTSAGIADEEKSI